MTRMIHVERPRQNNEKQNIEDIANRYAREWPGDGRSLGTKARDNFSNTRLGFFEELIPETRSNALKVLLHSCETGKNDDEIDPETKWLILNTFK